MCICIDVNNMMDLPGLFVKKSEKDRMCLFFRIGNVVRW